MAVLSTIREVQGKETVHKGDYYEWSVVSAGRKITEQKVLRISLGDDAKETATMYLVVFFGPNFVQVKE